MGEAAQKIKPSSLEINICGKLVAVEQIQGRQNVFIGNTIIIPAEDHFSKPQRVVVYSRERFSKEGDIVDIIAYVRPQWRSNDGNWYFSCSLWKDKPEW